MPRHRRSHPFGPSRPLETAHPDWWVDQTRPTTPASAAP